MPKTHSPEKNLSATKKIRKDKVALSIYWLNEKLVFPPHAFANAEGILALGGDLSPERLLLAYSNGIFPWYNEGDPIIWWSPPQRFVLYFDKITINRSLQKFLKKNPYTVTFDKAFEAVIRDCRQMRLESGTWISDAMMTAYIGLHQAGFAHSVEVWQEEELVGGLYGVSIGTYFCGESMFTRRDNASKVALLLLSAKLKEIGAAFIDCQVQTPHLEKLGACAIPRAQFLRELKQAVYHQPIKLDWDCFNEPM